MDAVQHVYVYWTLASHMKLMYLHMINKALATSFNAEQLLRK